MLFHIASPGKAPSGTRESSEMEESISLGGGLGISGFEWVWCWFLTCCCNTQLVVVLKRGGSVSSVNTVAASLSSALGAECKCFGVSIAEFVYVFVDGVFVHENLDVKTGGRILWVFPFSWPCARREDLLESTV